MFKKTGLLLALALCSSMAMAKEPNELANDDGLGDLDARYQQARRYSIGKGVPKDEAKAATLFRRLAEKGHAGAQCSLGLAYLFGDGVLKDENEGVKWLKMAAKQEHPAAEYFIGQCYQEGIGVTKDIDSGFRWQYKAALHGYAVPSDYSEAEKVSLKEWKAIRSETESLINSGDLAKALQSERDALGLAAEKLGKKRWPAAASNIRLVEIATKAGDWPTAYRHFYLAQGAVLNAMADVIEKPDYVEVPEYMRQLAKLQLKRKVEEKNGEESMRLMDEMVNCIRQQFGRDSMFVAPIIKERAQEFVSRGRLEAADADFEDFLRLNRLFLSKESDIMIMALMDYAGHMGQRGRHEKEAEILEEALSIQKGTGKMGYAFTWIKGRLLCCQVNRRISSSGNFKTAEELPSDEASLRKIADAGDPVACFRLSVGLSSGEFKSAITLEDAELSPESKLYREASTVPFLRPFKLPPDNLDERVARRLARLGHGFAQHALSEHLKFINQPWPKVEGMASMRIDSEITEESYILLRKAADSGVPDAIKSMGSLAYYGQYDKRPDELGKYDAFQEADGHWYKRIFIPETKSLRKLRRLSDDVVVVRKDFAVAAHYLKKDFIIGADVNSAYFLGIIHAEGAQESSSGSYKGIEFPAVIPDRLESAAYFYVCLFAKDFHMASKDTVEEMIDMLKLTPDQTAQAQQRAKALMSQRVRG